VATADLFYQRSFSNTKGDDDSFGATLYYPNEPWRADLHSKQIGENFFPALGFINRTGIRSYDGYVLRRDRNIYGLRLVDFDTIWNVVTGPDTRLQSRENTVEARFRTPIDDEFRVRLINDFEDVPRMFNVADRVPMPVG